MEDMLGEFLARHSIRAEEQVRWGDTPLHETSYVTAELPPMKYVPSVRAVVLNGDSVLVLHDGTRRSILPGGRSESGESVQETLSREVLEETGYVLNAAELLGFMHFHHLAPRPDGYAYPYPDFLQLVFAAMPGEHRPEYMVEDAFVKWAGMMRVEDVMALPLSVTDRVYLTVALDRAGDSRGDSRYGG